MLEVHSSVRFIRWLSGIAVRRMTAHLVGIGDSVTPAAMNRIAFAMSKAKQVLG